MKKPFTEGDGENEMIDTLRVYFNDGTFRQYAAVEDGNGEGQTVLFSTGTYLWPEYAGLHTVGRCG